jgi:hypothetical protein
MLVYTKDKSSIEIMEELRQKCYYPEQFETLQEYMLWFSKSLWKFNSIGIQIPIGTLKVKCDSFVEQLVSYGKIKREGF